MIVLMYINLEEQKELKKGGWNGKKGETKAQSGIQTSDLKLGEPVPQSIGYGFLGFFVQGNIQISLFSFLREYSPR